MHDGRFHDLIDRDSASLPRSGLAVGDLVLTDAGDGDPVLNDCKHNKRCNGREHNGTGHETIIWFRWAAPLLLCRTSCPLLCRT